MPPVPTAAAEALAVGLDLPLALDTIAVAVGEHDHLGCSTASKSTGGHSGDGGKVRFHPAAIAVRVVLAPDNWSFHACGVEAASDPLSWSSPEDLDEGSQDPAHQRTDGIR